MERDEAVKRLQDLEGKDLRKLADDYKVTVFKNGKLNKGWAGHTVERYLGLPINSAQSPNLGTWELKVVPLVESIGGALKVKETVAITMLDPEEVMIKDFQDSHLFTKLKKQIVVGRIRKDEYESESIVVSCNCFELERTVLYAQVEHDYEAIKHAVKNKTLASRIGRLIQARTKGAGHGTTSRAFYARKELVEFLVGIQPVKYIQTDSHPMIDIAVHVNFPRQPTIRHYGQAVGHQVTRDTLFDCSKHSGKVNAGNRAEVDHVMRRLPNNQSGEGRHKCPYCAYEAGFEAGMEMMMRSFKSKFGYWLEQELNKKISY